MDTKKLRQKILDLAIHGKLVPQDPNDEPASVLLERIRAEKAMLIKEGKIKAPKKSKSAGDTSHYPKDVPFEVPEGWEWCCLEDFVYAVTDGDHLPPPQSNSGIPFLVISDVNTGVINFDKARFVPDSYYDSLPTIRKASIHDILFTVTGSYGIVIPVETKERFCFQRHIGLIKTIESHEWLVFVLQSRYVQAYCDKVATGTAQKTVSLGALRDLPIPIPPRKEQERIGERLQEWLKISNHLGVAGAELNRNIVLAKTKILDFAIHGKLVPQAPSEEPAINLLKRINPNFTPSDNLHYEGELPNGWCFSTIGDLFRHNTGKALNGKDQVGEELRYITTSNLYWDRFDLNEVRTMPFTEAEKEKCRATKGDLLVCEGGDVGRAAIWPHDFDVMIQNHIHRLRPREDISVRFYYYIFLLYKQMGLIGGKGIAILGLSSRELDKMVVPVPPVPEQHRIVTVIENLFAQMDALISNLS